MKTILILMDTLQRKMIHAYNPGSEAITPNIDRLAARSVVFDQHYIGSAPCMPARRDILTGRLNFLERNWGPVEPFDITFPALLRQRGWLEPDQRALILTPEGREWALRLCRARRQLETLGVPEAAAAPAAAVLLASEGAALQE